MYRWPRLCGGYFTALLRFVFLRWLFIALLWYLSSPDQAYCSHSFLWRGRYPLVYEYEDLYVFCRALVLFIFQFFYPQSLLPFNIAQNDMNEQSALQRAEIMLHPYQKTSFPNQNQFCVFTIRPLRLYRVSTY